MRHLLALLAFVLLLALGQALPAWLAAGRDGPQAVWLLLKDRPGPALNRLLAGQDLRLVDTWWGGRLVQLQAGPGAPPAIPAGLAWLRLAGPQAVLGLPGCGG
jgi:hypothetical protein